VTRSDGTTTTLALNGKTCSKTRNGATKCGFFGRSDTDVHVFLKEEGTTVRGFEISR
jgi:hypothetical protein